MLVQASRGGRVKLAHLTAPQSDYANAEKGDALNAMELALSLEKLNFNKLRQLHGIADKHEDAQMADFVEDMLAEQVSFLFCRKLLMPIFAVLLQLPASFTAAAVALSRCIRLQSLPAQQLALACHVSGGCLLQLAALLAVLSVLLSGELLLCPTSSLALRRHASGAIRRTSQDV